VEVDSSNLSIPTKESCKRLKKGGLAQLARAPALQAGGQRFDSVILHQKKVRQSNETVFLCLERKFG
jgi:hypothetical protein